MKIKDKVLIVEDEQSISNFISMILTANGYDTIVVRSGEEALTMISSHCPDLIVLDLGLPDMDGMEVLKSVRKWSNLPVVVVSAQGDTTDDLIEKAAEINPKASKREMDMLLSAGEQISISLLAMAIESLGFPVCSLLGWQAGFTTNSVYGSARIKKVRTERIEMEIAKKNIVVVAGFQGIDKYGDVTTLGRGGSDTTAVAMAVALQADLCQIFTDVDGVYTCDPRVVPEARKLPEITYNEMLELASLGAQVRRLSRWHCAVQRSAALTTFWITFRKASPFCRTPPVPAMQKKLSALLVWLAKSAAATLLKLNVFTSPSICCRTTMRPSRQPKFWQRKALSFCRTCIRISTQHVISSMPEPLLLCRSARRSVPTRVLSPRNSFRFS